MPLQTVYQFFALKVKRTLTVGIVKWLYLGCCVDKQMFYKTLHVTESKIKRS